MIKQRRTKHALLLSLIALCLCFSMLVGSTYAWFTDNVTSMNNVIKSGTLDIEMEYSLDGKKWSPVKDDVSIFDEDALWEPGYTQVVALRVKNVGTLALKYELSTNVYLEKEGTNVYDKKFKLSNYLKVYTSSIDTDSDTVVSDKIEKMIEGGRENTLKECAKEVGFNAVIGTSGTKVLPEDTHVVALAITMPTTVDNNANYRTGTEAPYIRFGIDLYATQVTEESDSFGIDYDKDADFVRLPMAKVQDTGAQTLEVSNLFGNEGDLKGQLAMDATFVFVAPDSAEEEYANWIADYEVSIDTDLDANSAILAGSYDLIENGKWQAFRTPAVEANTPVRLLGSQGLNLTYDNICTFVKEFRCGVASVDVPEGATLTVALKLYKQDIDGNVLEEKIVGVFTHEF